MPKTSVASLVLTTTASLGEIWAALKTLDYRNPPLSSTSISPEIEWARSKNSSSSSSNNNKGQRQRQQQQPTAREQALAEAEAEAASHLLFSEISQQANPHNRSSGAAEEAPPSRYVAERLATRQTDRRCFSVAWAERERTHRDLLEDVRALKKQAKRVNEIRIVPITTPVRGKSGQLCQRVFVEWTCASSIFCSDAKAMQYRSKLTLDANERALEMQHGLGQLRKLFDATVVLKPAQVEALLIEQHNAGTDSRFFCSTANGGAAARSLLEGKYWELCNRGPVGQQVLLQAARLFPAAIVANTDNGAFSAPTAQAAAIDACIATAVGNVLRGSNSAITETAASSALEPSTAESMDEDRLAVLALGISALHAFMQVNFTGPHLRISEADEDSASALKVFVDAVQQHVSKNTTFSSEERSTNAASGTSSAEAHRSPYDYAVESHDGSKERQAQQNAAVARALAASSAWFDYLNVDGEIVYPDVRRPELMCIASSVFRALANVHTGDQATEASAAPTLWSASWWLMRCTAAWQRLIEDSFSQSLWDIQTKCFDRLCEHGFIAAENSETSASVARGAIWWEALDMPASLGISRNSLRALALQERAVAFAQIENYHDSRACVERAGAALGVKIVVTGAQGRGTKFQTFDTPQLVAVVQNYDSGSDDDDDDENARQSKAAKQGDSKNGGNKRDDDINLQQKKHIARFLHGKRFRDEREAAGVRTVKIEDVDPYSHLMEQPILSERRAAERVNRTVPAVAQAMMLAECRYIQSSAAIDATVQSQMKTFLAQTVRHPQAWAIQSQALFEKSLLELTVSRLPERALLQLQALVDQHTRFINPSLQHNFVDTSEVPPSERLKLVHALDFQPYWVIKRVVGQQYLKANLVKSALQLFKSLKMWNEIIHCYVLLGERTKAEKLLREQLASAATPDLWCVLGGLTKDEKCLHTAWELSNGSCARAMRDLARMEMARGDVDSAITHMRVALDLNPLRPHDWFFLGMAAQKADRVSIAMDCFKHVVQILPDSAEAWGNLGALHGRAGNYKEAIGAMEEAAKLRPRNWRIWANLRLFATEAGDMAKMIAAANRLLDLHEDIDLHKTGALVDPSSLLALLDAFPEADVATWADLEAEEARAKGAMQIVNRVDPKHVGANGPPLMARALPNMYWGVQLIRRSCKLDSENPLVWHVAAEFERRLGRPEGVLECVLKQCRAAMVAGWNEDAAKFSRVVRVAVHLSTCYLAVGTADALYRGKIFIGRSVLGHAREKFEGTPEFSQLQQAVTALESASARS